jgi:hypothetical protein
VVVRATSGVERAGHGGRDGLRRDAGRHPRLRPRHGQRRVRGPTPTVPPRTSS